MPFAGVLWSVPVRPGDAQLAFLYRPNSFFIGAFITIGTLATLAL